MTDPWTAYLDRLDALAEAARPTPWSVAEVTAEDLIFLSLVTPAIRRLVAEVRRLRGSLHTILMMEGGPGVTGCPAEEACRICEEARGALAVPPPEDL